MRSIESMIIECGGGAHDLRGPYPAPTEEYLIARRTELLEMIRILSVLDRQFTGPAISELPQGNVVQGDAHAVVEIQQHVQRPTDTETLALASVAVRCYIYISISLADHLLNVGYVSVSISESVRVY